MSKSKIQYMEKEVKYLGHLISKGKLFVTVSDGAALGVLTLKWKDKRKPTAYLSKLLDLLSQGLLECVQAVAAAALLVKESRKLTFGG